MAPHRAPQRVTAPAAHRRECLLRRPAELIQRGNVSRLPEAADQVVVLQFASGNVRDVGGGRLVLVRELIHEIYDGLKGTSPVSGAVPSNLPLLRTLQLAADASRGSLTDHRLITRDGQADGQPTQRQASAVI